MQVLRMLAEHKVSAEQADRLLEALGREGEERMPADAQRAIGKLGEIIGRAFTGRRERDEREEPADGERVPEPEEGFALGAGDSLVVRAKGANVRIVQSSDGEVATVRSSGARRAAVRRSGNTCTVQATGREREGNLDIGIPPVKSLDVKLSGGNASLEGVGGKVRISLRGGELTAGGCTGRFDVKLSGGNASLEGVGGKVRIRLRGGELTADGCTGRFDVECMGGNAELTGLISGIDLKCMGGSVALDALRLTEGKHTVKAMGGRVDLVLSPRSSVAVRAKAFGGAVTSDVPSPDEGPKRGGDEYRIGDGAARLDVKAMGGDVHIGLAQQEPSAATGGEPRED